MRLIPRVVSVIRTRGYSLSTEKVYVHWILRYIRFHERKHPAELREIHIMEFLSSLANEGNVSASTQNQALNAIVFLYKRVLEIDICDFSNHARAKKPELMPVVLSKSEVAQILQNLSGSHQLMVGLLYGCGLRLKECLRLRVKDIDFERNQVNIRQSKGKKDRVIPLPKQIKLKLERHLVVRERLHRKDLANGQGSVYLPDALEKKYPQAPYEWGWQYVFPAHRHSKDPRTGIVRRHHLYDSVLIRHVRKAATSARVHKKLTTHCFRHSYATHLLENHYDIRTVQELLGHKDVRTTMRYVHVMDKGRNGTQSPLDALWRDVVGQGDCRVVRPSVSAPRNDEKTIRSVTSAPRSGGERGRVCLWGWLLDWIHLLAGGLPLSFARGFEAQAVVRSATSAPRNDG